MARGVVALVAGRAKRQGADCPRARHWRALAASRAMRTHSHVIRIGNRLLWLPRGRGGGIDADVVDGYTVAVEQTMLAPAVWARTTRPRAIRLPLVVLASHMASTGEI